MKEQFKQTRKELIVKIKAIATKRNTLKGVSGTTAEWKQLTAQMNKIQEQIDTINRALGNSVSSHNTHVNSSKKTSIKKRSSRTEEEVAAVYIAG